MMVPSIEIVTHCYCPPGLTSYAQMLKHQWASLLRYSHVLDPVHATLTVCMTDRDEVTARQVQLCFDQRSGDWPQIQVMRLEPRDLFRRAIGRNFAAMVSAADVVWFADVDMLFGPGCLGAACRHALQVKGLVMPQAVQISFDNRGEFPEADRPHHCVGQRYLARYSEDVCPEIDPDEFGGPWTGPCIGGVQIVDGDTARTHGYLHGTDWVKPVSEAEGFRSCRCDPKYRRSLKRKGVPGPVKVPIPNCYRIRHLEDGRDFSYAGNKVGKQVW